MKEMNQESVSFDPREASVFHDGKFEGWGTSFCWWAHRIGYSARLTEETAKLFYGDEGLRLNIVRYNIGGGDDPSHTHITRTDSDIPGYAVNAHVNANTGKYEWEYDWNADADQMHAVQKAMEACGDSIIVEAFSNSPPYFMTHSGCASGAVRAADDNLKPEYYTDFAAYLADVVQYWETHGVPIQSISPMNEPYTDYWGAYHWKQEGCHFDQGTSQSDILVGLKKALLERDLGHVLLAGTDETSIDVQYDSYLALREDAKQAVDRIDTHSYQGNKRERLQLLAQQEGKNLWMSEVDDGGTAGEQAGEMGAGLWLAQRIIQDMNGLRPSAWILWQIIDNHICAEGYKGRKDNGMVELQEGYWGMAVADHDQQSILLTMKYYAMGQFTRFIRPGYTVIPGDAQTLAAYDRTSDTMVIVAVNLKGYPVERQFDLSRFTDVGSRVEVYRTSGSMEQGEKWARKADLHVQGQGAEKRFVAELKENSITTFVVRRDG